MRTLCLFAMFILQGGMIAFAQCADEPGPDGLSWEYETEKKDFSILSFLGNAFTPRVVQDVRAVRAYVRDERFVQLTKLCGDHRAIDAIYLRALKVAEYNIGRALFLAMAAALDHQNLDVRMPIVESIKMPLTFEEDSLFKARTKNLPSRLYPDSPTDDHGDKDKLQHFFGSAYISYITESREIARSTGNMVEWGEAQFVVGGADDMRDRKANKQGERFGNDLLSVKTLLPSDYLSLPVKIE